MVMTILLAMIFGLLGLAIGSFLNVCIDRLPAGKSLAFPASHCDACQHPLAIKDNVPVFSYLFLQGKCRYCGAAIPRRVLLVEMLTGAIFALLFLKYGLTPEYGIILLYSCVLLTLAMIDLEHGLLLNVIIFPTMAIALIASIFLPELVVGNYPPRLGVLNSLLGGAVGLVMLLIPALLIRSGMGEGDVKMAGMLGLMTGFPGVFVAIIGGIILGGLWAMGLLALKKKKRKDAIPFGPFLTLGGLAALLYGNAIIEWYLKLF